MAVSTASLAVAASVAVQHARRMEEEHRELERKEQKKKEEALWQQNCNALLLNRKEKPMKVEDKEKIEVYRLVHMSLKEHYDKQWVLKRKNNENMFSHSSLYLCLDEVFSSITLKEFELVPVGVDKHGEVDEFVLICKVADEAALRKEASLSKMAEKMSKDLESAW